MNQIIGKLTIFNTRKEEYTIILEYKSKKI